ASDPRSDANTLLRNPGDPQSPPSGECQETLDQPVADQESGNEMPQLMSTGLQMSSEQHSVETSRLRLR
ncbi:MAG: hypothetical protein ACRD1T_06345, partial [Acidimicrobiia bacterium]